MTATDASTRIRAHQVYHYRGTCRRIVSAGKSGIRAQVRNGMRGRFGTEVSKFEEADFKNWKLISGPGSEGASN